MWAILSTLHPLEWVIRMNTVFDRWFCTGSRVSISVSSVVVIRLGELRKCQKGVFLALFWPLEPSHLITEIIQKSWIPQLQDHIWPYISMPGMEVIYQGKNGFCDVMKWRYIFYQFLKMENFSVVARHNWVRCDLHLKNNSSYRVPGVN